MKNILQIKITRDNFSFKYSSPWFGEDVNSILRQTIPCTAREAGKLLRCFTDKGSDLYNETRAWIAKAPFILFTPESKSWPGEVKEWQKTLPSAINAIFGKKDGKIRMGLEMDNDRDADRITASLFIILLYHQISLLHRSELNPWALSNKLTNAFDEGFDEKR